MTNIHAAYGMFYDNMRTLQNFGELTWPQAQTIIISNPDFNDPLAGKSRDAYLSTAPPNISVMSNATVNPYAHQFNVGLNQTLTREIAATIDFSMVNRFSDRDTIDVNLPDQVSRVKPYPQFARVSFWQPTANNTYNALLVKVEKRMSHHYQFLVSYTLSHAKDENYVNGFADEVRLLPGDAVWRGRPAPPPGRERGLPAPRRVPALGDRRLPVGPAVRSLERLDLNNDGYTGDLPVGVAPGSGCRSLDVGAVNTFRSGRG